MGQTVSHQYGGIYSPDPQMTYCPKCGEYTLTRVNYIMGGVACPFVCCIFFPCIFLPFVTNCWKDAKHHCSVTNTYLGKFVRQLENRRYGGRTVVVVQPPIPPRQPPQPQVQPVMLASAPPMQAYTPPTTVFFSKQLSLIMTYVHRQRYGYAQYFGPKPQQVHCPTCNQNTTTKLKYVQLKCLEVLMYILFVVVIIFTVVSIIFACTKPNKSGECFMLLVGF
uniref:LITAF domain-containing protein n=1 Tax=Meloidogyne javanica TaxID=6303 RepID=A0A915M8M9_MELJA